MLTYFRVTSSLWVRKFTVRYCNHGHSRPSQEYFHGICRQNYSHMYVDIRPSGRKYRYCTINHHLIHQVAAYYILIFLYINKINNWAVTLHSLTHNPQEFHTIKLEAGMTDWQLPLSVVKLELLSILKVDVFKENFIPVGILVIQVYVNILFM